MSRRTVSMETIAGGERRACSSTGRSWAWRAAWPSEHSTHTPRRDLWPCRRSRLYINEAQQKQEDIRRGVGKVGGTYQQQGPVHPISPCMVEHWLVLFDFSIYAMKYKDKRRPDRLLPLAMPTVPLSSESEKQVPPSCPASLEISGKLPRNGIGGQSNNQYIEYWEYCSSYSSSSYYSSYYYSSYYVRFFPHPDMSDLGNTRKKYSRKNVPKISLAGPEGSHRCSRKMPPIGRHFF